MSKYIYLVFIVLLLSMSGATYFMYKDNQHKQEQIALLSKDIDILKEQNQLITKKHEEVLESYSFYRGKVAGIAEEQKRKEQELEQYRSRLASLSLAKPGLIEIKANKATVKVFEQFEQATSKSQHKE